MRQISILAFLLLLTVNSFSAVKTWDGDTNNSWATGTNWSGDTPPAGGDQLVFPANAVTFDTNNNLFLFSPYNSISFDGGTYNITGNPFQISNGITINSGFQTFQNGGIQLTAPQSFNVGLNATGIFGVVSVGSNNLTINGDGISVIAVIQGSGGIIKNGNGIVLLGTSFNYSGQLTHNSGIFIVDANIPNSPVIINAGTIGGGELGFSGFGGTGTVGNVNVTQGVISAGSLSSPTGILSTGNLTFTADGNYACKISGTTAGANGHDQLNVYGNCFIKQRAARADSVE